MIYVNNQELKFTKFPAGEIQGNFTEEFYTAILNNVCIKDSVCVTAYLLSSDSIFLLAQLKQFLNQNFSKEQHLLRLCYQPYGRYDRKMTSEFDVCSLRIFASFLNSMNWDEVIVPDPHSSVTPALLNKSIVQEQYQMVYNEVGEAEQYDAIIAPDIGAVKKARKYADEVGLPLLVCEKKRDPNTGKILGVEILNEKDIPTTFKDSLGRPYFLVVDDICDGGGTFVALSESLRKDYNCFLDLYVTHGLFTKGKELLEQHYSNVYAYHDYRQYLEG